MAFDSLSDKLQNIFKNLRGKGRLSEADVKAALKEVKMALLEADVNFKVVKNFIKSVKLLIARNKIIRPIYLIFTAENKKTR
jgi:signal recognition particle subunit SRP54